MLKRFYFFYVFLGCISLTVIHPVVKNHSNAKESLKIELKEELKKGNLLIGLKQYLGGKYDNFSKNNSITFTTENKFLTLKSFNGINYKSKKITISWKNIPLKKPYKEERLVFGPYASYETAQKKSKTLRERGLQAIVAYPNDWEVWINNVEADLPADQFEYTLFNKINKSQITPFLNNEYYLQKLEGPIYISSDEDIKINNFNFGKRFYLTKDSYGTWTLIQKIQFDNYLKGVLPHEIGINSPLEALKAQAVIARTWAIYNSERFNMDKYHLCITTQCQVYKPSKIQNIKLYNAINQTSNQIITYQNKPINSFYHGSNGGISANASESWEITNYPYFVSFLDGSKLLNKFLTIPIIKQKQLNKFLDFEKKSFYGDNHYLFRWDKKISSQIIIEKLLKNKIITNKASVDYLKVKKRGLSGRVTTVEIKINGVNEPIILEKDKIRRIFTFLPSNLFTINKLNDDLWFFKGGGFGHGVGLSQSGAIEMAELGFTYEQILNHYYQGTKIQKIEILSK